MEVRSFLKRERKIGVGFAGMVIGNFGGSCFRLAWDAGLMTLFDLLPAVRPAHPLLIGHPSAQFKNTGIESVVLDESGMLLVSSMFKIILVLLLADLAVLAVGRYKLNPLISGLSPSDHLILLNPLIEHVSMIVFIHLVEVLNEMMVTV